MSEFSEGSIAGVGGSRKLKPIDYKGAGRLGGRLQWKEDPRAKTERKDYPFSKDPDPGARIEAQGITLVSKVESEADDEQSRSQNEMYLKFDQAKSKNAERQAEKRSIRATDINLRDLEVQGALLGSEHKIFSILERVGAKITEAEKRLSTTGGLSRTTTTEKYSFYVSKRENINAYTYPLTKTVFFESGVLTLLDDYLKNSKGYGLAEDHIALLLAHEVSHSDPEAETGYLNEEYCDVQGMILGAESGYNPAAAVDVEDFLIWLDEGSKKYKDGEGEKEEEKQNAYIPSHPSPQNRRSVLINVLKDNTRVLPNQTKQYSFVEGGVIDDIGGQMSEWQTTSEQRVLPVSRDETKKQIEESGNLSELLDSLMGYHLQEKAEFTREIVNDKKFVDKVTLYQAVAAEIRAKFGDRAYFKIHGKDGILGDITRLTFGDRWGGESEAYETSDVVIGGLSKQLEGTSDQVAVSTKIKEAIAECLNDLSQVSAEVHVRSEAEWDATEEEKDLKERKAKMDGYFMTRKVERLFEYVVKRDGELDVARLLSGDFTEDETLSTLLNNLEINNFDNYLSRIRINFQNLDPNDRVKAIMSERTANLFIDSTVLAEHRDRVNREQVSVLLEQTLPYRMARFAERAVAEDQTDRYPQRIQMTDELKEIVKDKLRNYSREFSDTPQEQEMFYQMMSIITGDKLSTDIEEQIASSTILSGESYSKKIEERFKAPGLAEVIKRLRISPVMGGDFLKSYMKSVDRYDDRTGCGRLESSAKYLGRRFDFIRIYYGECEFEESRSTDYSRGKTSFRIKNNDALGNLELVARRKNEIPVFGNNIEEFSIEESFDIVGKEIGEGEKGFEMLKQAAKASEYEKRYLDELVSFQGVTVEEKTKYLMSSLENGEFTLERLCDVLEMEKRSVRSESIDKEKEKYKVAMAILRQLPVYPIPQLGDREASNLNDNLFKVRLKHAKYDRLLEERSGEDESKEVEGVGFVSLDEAWSIDLFEGLTEEEKKFAKFNFVVDFVDEGGSVSISKGKEWDALYSDGMGVYWADMRNEGAEVDLIGIVQEMSFPTDFIKKKVDDLFERNKSRFTEAEKDKWLSLVAYSQQPYINRWNLTSRDRNFKLKENGRFRDCDSMNVDHLLITLDKVMQMPYCSYRDCCLNQLEISSSEAIQYEAQTKKGRIHLDHPARSFFEQKMEKALASGFSKQGLGIREKSNKVSTRESANRSFVPASERLSGDAAAGFYVEGTTAAKVWQGIVSQYSISIFHTPLGVEYRESERFKDMDRNEIEKTILYERLRLLQNMSEGQLKEALTLYSLRTAYDNLSEITDSGFFKNELSMLTKSYGERFDSPQAKQRLFEMSLKLEIGEIDGEINPASIRKRFSTQPEFLSFVTEAIPEKTAFRDSYVLLASEVYPLKVGDASNFRKLMFSVDYGTQDKSVLQQRAGLEVGKVIKQNEKYHPKHSRELLMWLVDEDLQISSYDELLKNLDTSPVGRKLLKGVLTGLEFESISEEDETPTVEEKLNRVAIKAGAEIFIRLPYPVKKKLVKKVLKRVQVKQRDLAFATRAGMPSVVQLLSEKIGIIGGQDYLTYNSLLESTNLENPTVKTMFFDLMLGENGLLEEPVITDFESFNERIKDGFEGSEMHNFVDDIVDLIARKGRLNRSEKSTIRVVSHSLIEGMSPTRRATVLHNLMSEIPKIDFSQPDKEELRSQIFTTALSSFGVLGAKLGQTDEVIPRGWGKDASSLKHSTEPMPVLAVADIFKQEGLSRDYQILGSSGAASTACGYIVENPSGEKQFVKVVRPEVVLDWREDFIAVEHMLKTLKKTGMVGFETGPVVGQLKKLVEEELQTAREIDNVLQYVSVETDMEREKRAGIRAAKIPLQRIGVDGNVVERAENSLMIFAEPLGEEQGFIELSRIKSDPGLSKEFDLRRINTIVVEDFLHRALELGSWHSDPHEGNIMVSKTGVVRKELTSEDLIWIDFGQTGTIEGEERRSNAARFLVGLGLYDRGEIARSIYEGLVDKTNQTQEMIKRELSLKPGQLQDSTVRVLAKYEVEEYMTNFLKATINILPYLRGLSRREQFDLIAQYMPEDMRGKLRTRLIEKVVERV